MYCVTKRTVDLTVALLAILILSPIWLIAILGILISDPGPIFYKATRIGYQGKEFQMYKFRSMRVPRAHEVSEASFKADVNRIFSFGAFMRRSKIDELPQFINVVKGNMAIVGPRPAAKDQVQIMRAGKYEIANSVRPGVTGPAALYDYIYGDSVEDADDYERLVLPTRRELEAYYPEKISAFFDLKMIWYTVVCILYAIAGKEPVGIFNELTNCVNAKVEEVALGV